MNTNKRFASADPSQLLSVVVPVFNEESALPVFHERLVLQLRKLNLAYEVIYVDDGSADLTATILSSLTAGNRQVRQLSLSRNFGKEIAISAGLDHALGDAVIVMDADGQDPPEEIPRMIAEWQRGYDMICMRRTSRNGESWFKRSTAHAFYRVMRKISKIDMPADVGDFRLLDRTAVDAIKQLPERARFMKGLFAWIGFRRIVLNFEREPRCGGRSKFNYWRLWNFALDGITSFTVTPLKIASYVGFIVASASFFYGGYIFIKTSLFGDPVQGFPTLAVIMLFLGGIQLIAIGVLGEYVSRIFIETKNRPLYFVKDTSPGRHAPRTVDRSHAG